jgi:prostaglandin-endoperoxide synthase 2
MKSKRNTDRDGLSNRIEFYLLTHFQWFWNLVQKSGFLKRKMNRFLINQAIYKVPPRPYAFSTLAPYTSWTSLTDRTWSGRHLPPMVKDPSVLPPVAEVAKLFLRDGEGKLSSKSTLLFSYFAQWFTDGFLRTDPHNPLKNHSNHEVDVTPLYGEVKQQTDLLRTWQGGKLKSQWIEGEEYPPYYFEDGEVKEEFKDLPLRYPGDPGDQSGRPPLSPEQRAKLFAVGGERGNVSIGYVMMTTLFLREHNRICDQFAIHYPNWDDEQCFQTARNVVTVLLLKIVVEEYINHITPYHFEFILDPQAFPNERWCRQNWMTLEFNLLYRWHSLVTNTTCLNGQTVSTAETLWNNDLITSRGLGELFAEASSQPAGEIGVFNTPSFIVETDQKSIELGRRARLASYNDYREMCKFPRVTAFDQISGDPAVQRELEQLYGHVDNIEFYVGLFAEDIRENSVVAGLIGRLVGVDAFSQALTNPLLAESVFNETTFSPLGLQIIQTTHCLSDILHRNLPQTQQKYKVTMTQGQGFSDGMHPVESPSPVPA